MGSHSAQAALWRAIGQNPTEADLKRIIEENDTGTGHFQLDAPSKRLSHDSHEPHSFHSRFDESDYVNLFLL
eukprot:Skav229513  [mRNA]  locus=scaffold842:117995:118955:- [translate_table: standard]